MKEMELFNANVKKEEYYYLMNKDDKVLKFNSIHNFIRGYEIVEIYNKELVPFVFKSNINRFEDWINERPIATNQEHLHNVLSSLNMQSRDTIALLKVNGGFSLNDAYWIKSCEPNNYNIMQTWDTGNLYGGDWDSSLGLVSFFGNESSLGGTLRTPEITNQGSVGKAWRNINNKLLLYKKTSEGAANYGKEHYAEIIASKLGQLINLDCVKYWGDSWHGKDCCVCEIFTDENTGYLPMSYYLTGLGMDRGDWRYSNIVKLLKDADVLRLNDLLIFDFIIENWDRHLSNFGMLIDNNTQTVLGLSPVFDNGYSLMSRDLESDFITRDYGVYSKESPAFKDSNRAIATHIINENKQRYKHWAKIISTQLDSLIIHDCPQWYMDAVLKLIYLRCKEIQQM